jgi:hypothetical protein
MLSNGSIILVVLGFALAIVGGLSRGYIRSRQRESGVTLTSWTTVSDDFRSAEQYLQLAKKSGFPMRPLMVTAIGLFGGFLLMLVAVLRG